MYPVHPEIVVMNNDQRFTRRKTHRAGTLMRVRRVHLLCKLEINETATTANRDHNIAITDISMKDPSLMEIFYCCGRRR